MADEFEDLAAHGAEAKKRVQEAVWQWAQRALVLAVVFGFGFFAAWVSFGYGPDGAPALRLEKVRLEDEVKERRNKQVDVEGQLTVVQGKLQQCNTELSKARTSLAQAQQQLQAAQPR